MGALAPVRRFFQGLTGKGRMVTSGAMRSDPPPMGTREFLELYETTPWVRGMLQKVGRSVGCTQWTLWRTDTETQVVGHQLSRLMKRPNPMMPGKSFWNATQVSLDLVGCAFFVKQRNGVGAVNALWPIPAHWVVETPTPAKPEFRVSFSRLQANIPEKEMLWINDISPENPYRRGTGIIQALGDEVETDEYSAKHAKQIFFNRAMPEIVIQDPGASADEIRNHERAWNQRLQGLFRVMRPFFTNKKLEIWQPQSMNLENLTLVPLRQFERDIQLQAFGMPPEQMGIVENSNRATAEASNYVYEERIVEPRREFLADQLTYLLAWDYDERLEVRFVSTVPQDKAHKLSVMKAAPWAFEVDEIRAAAGEQPFGGDAGRARCVPLSNYLTLDPLDQEARPKSSGDTPPEGEEKPKPKDDKDDDEGGDDAA